MVMSADADNLATGRLSDLSRDLLDLLGDVDKHEIPAVLGEALRGDAANAAGGARDDSDIAHFRTILFAPIPRSIMFEVVVGCNAVSCGCLR